MPKDILSKTAGTSNRIQLSAKLINERGGDFDDLPMSYNTAKRKRKHAATETASTVREDFLEKLQSFKVRKTFPLFFKV